MIRAAVIGAAGYTGGELLRLLTLHPRVRSIACVSASQAGKAVAVVHRDLFTQPDLRFTAELDPKDCDVAFLCGSHGESQSLIEKHGLASEAKLRIIDLSQDFRLDPNYVYGLPEAFAAEIFGARRIANPGCFATAIQLGLLPLAAAGLLAGSIHITAVTGSTGAGQKLQESSHFSWRAANLSVYKVFEHQHLAEIERTLGRLQKDFDGQLFFVPMRGSFTRGILASMYLPFQGTYSRARELYHSYYAGKSFAHCLEGEVDLKQVVNTNQMVLSLKVLRGHLHLTVCIDNLLKGASGQAVQNMNLAFDLPETEGLRLKPLAF